jgi:transposase
MSPELDRKTAIRTDLGAIFVSLELSRSTWLITSLSPGGGEKMSKHSVLAGDMAAGGAVFETQAESVRADREYLSDHRQSGGRIGRIWIHRVLQSKGIESHVVDAASITSHWRRRPLLARPEVVDQRSTRATGDVDGL